MITGEIIRLVRIWKKLKQKTVANKLGISQPAYSKLEKCKHINQQRLDKLLNILNCSERDLEIFRRLIPHSEK